MVCDQEQACEKHVKADKGESSLKNFVSYQPIA
jgi:hypothetical protein